MAFRIAYPVLALPVRLVGRFAVYLCPGRPGASKVGVNIGDIYDKPRAGHAWGYRRTELVLYCDAVKPDGCPTDAHFAMDWLAVGSPLDPSRFETERLNQKVMSPLNVPIYQQRDNSFECRHQQSSSRLVG
jgi:hypothetical protein